MSVQSYAPSSLRFTVPCFGAPLPLTTPCVNDEAFVSKQIQDVTQKDFARRLKKVEFSNPFTKQWESLDPLVVKELVNIGMDAQKVSRLFQSLSNFKSIYSSLTDLVSDVMYSVQRLYSDEGEGFWRVIDYMADQRLSQNVNGNKDFTIQKKGVLNPSTALIIEGEGPRETDLLRKTVPSMITLGSLAEKYDTVSVKHIDSLEGMCKAIQSAAQNGLQFLMIRAHGSSMSISMNENPKNDHMNLKVWSDLRRCVEKLSPKVMLIFHSCSSGAGKETGWNMANAFARVVPKGVQIFAPTELLSFVTLTTERAFPNLVLRFWTSLGYRDRVELSPYHIDTSNPSKHCFKDRISFLPFCNDRPLLKADTGKDNFLIQRKFYSKHFGKWQKISPSCWNFLETKGFSNKHLEVISASNWRINAFCADAALQYPQLGAKKLVKRMIKDGLAVKADL